MKILKEYSFALINPKLASTAFRVAIVVGSILFTINHGHALIRGKMTRDRVAPRFARSRSASLRLTTKCQALPDRWLAGLLTYIVPYMVNVHGQFISRPKDALTIKNGK